MHRVHNLFPADCRADLTPAPPPPPLVSASTLIDNVFSRARDSRVFFVTARPSTRGDRENAGAENEIAMGKILREMRSYTGVNSR